VNDLPDDSGLTVSSVCFRLHPFERALQIARELGFDSVDLVGLRGLCEHVPVNGDAAEFAAAADVVRRSGVRPASVNGDPGSFDADDDRADVLGRIDRLVGFAAETTTPLLVLPCGEKRDGRTDAPAYRALADGLNAAAEIGRSRGVRIAVEAPYFGRPIDRLDRTSTLLELLDPDIEVALDVSHVDAADESVLDAWDLLRSRVGIIHLRDSVSGNIRRAIGHGRIDFAGFLDAVAADAFRGDTVLELETRDAPYASKEEEVLDAVQRLRGPARKVAASA